VAPTFEQVAEKFVDPMVAVLDRWADEHAYEADAFAEHFRPLAAAFGWDVVKVHGDARKMAILVEAPTGTRANITLTTGGSFTVKIVRH
jgi:hypothetical protein